MGEDLDASSARGKSSKALMRSKRKGARNHRLAGRQARDAGGEGAVDSRLESRSNGRSSRSKYMEGSTSDLFSNKKTWASKRPKPAQAASYAAQL